MYLSFGVSDSSFASLFCNSFDNFFETLVTLSAFFFTIKSLVASAVFWTALFEAVFIASAVDYFALSIGFWPYLLLKFLLMFLAKDKNPYPFTYFLFIGSIEY